MSEIRSNQSYQTPQMINAQHQSPVNYNNYFKYSASPQPPQPSPEDEFRIQHRKNGLFERLYNGLKNITNLGTGSKKAKLAIERAHAGQISEEEARQTITKYRNSQANSAQMLGDITSFAAAFATFFGLRKLIKMQGAKAEINKHKKSSLADINFIDNPNEIFHKITKSKSKFFMATAGIAGLVGGITKLWTGRLNRIGSKGYSTDKKDFNNLATSYDETAYKYEKKTKRIAKRKENWRNFLSGCINGLMMPVTIIGGGLIGAPLYLIGNSLNRYFVGNTNEHRKSLNSYMGNLQNDSLIHAGLAAGLAIPLIKKGKFTKIFDENLDKAVNKLKDAKLKPSEYGKRSTYKELESLLLNSKEISAIMENPSIDDGIKKLTDENIFAVKFKQISNDGSEFTKVLREDCPPTRCVKKADGNWDFSKVQSYVDKQMGNGKYSIEKCLGVGTVAETYLAKTESGQEVCLKILKEGINESKILADKEKFAQIIKNSGKTKDETDYLLRNLDDLADGILKEVDFNNEKNAAKELVKHTKSAKVVKPITVKNGIYVMEKADGISLSSLVELTCARHCLDIIKNNPLLRDEREIKNIFYGNSRIAEILSKSHTQEETIANLEKYIKKIEDKTPQYGEINLSKEDYKFLINEYQRVLVEQFSRVDKNGKVLHADIHPGNIFINIDTLRKARKSSSAIDNIKTHLGTGKSHDIFTLIDTGNTIKQTAEQSQHFINLSSYIDRGSVKDIAEYVLDDAVLPKGMSMETAKKEIEEALRKEFFDNQTALGNVTNESILTKTSNIMRKYDILPADTQLNLNKAQQSAQNSLEELIDSMLFFCLRDFKTADIPSLMKMAGSIIKDTALMKKQYENLKAKQEKLNLLQMTPAQILKQKKNPNLLETNSEDYLVYKLKQSMKTYNGFEKPNIM